jgi:hypothetical protein
MKTFLFPRWCRVLGYFIFILSLFTFNKEFKFLNTAPLNASNQYTTTDIGGLFNNNNLTDEISYSLLLLGLFMIGFSKLKREDEYSTSIRLRALNLTVYLTYFLFIISTFVIYGLEYLLSIFLGLFVIPALYIVIFNYLFYIHPLITRKNNG